MYRITEFDGSQIDLPAVIEYDQDYEGERFDRLTIGSGQPGATSMVVWFDRTEPWVFAIKAVETYNDDFSDSMAIVESFEPPLPFDVSAPLGETAMVDATVLFDFQGSHEELGATYEVTVDSITETKTVPLGTFDDVSVVSGEVSGEIMGGGAFGAEMWFHQEEFLLRFQGPPAFDVMELVEAWS